LIQAAKAITKFKSLQPIMVLVCFTNLGTKGVLN